MSESILGRRDKLTPLRLLSLMPDWAEQNHFVQIWGPDMGQHFWRKFTVERKRNVTNFVLELDAKPEAQLWHFLMRMSKQGAPETVCLSVEEEKKEFMIFYKRNHVGVVLDFMSMPMIAVTHEYVGNIVARNPVAALHEMHPDMWDLSHDARVSRERLPIINYPEISAGDIIVEYNADGPKQAWVVILTDLDELELDELPPW